MTAPGKLTIGLAAGAAAVWLLGQALPRSDRRHQHINISNLSASKSSGEAKLDPGNLETATLAAGCFWCVEAVLERIAGVHHVVSGYSGGASEDPDYQEISTGKSGHAECVQVKFDPQTLSYDQLLTVFWELHDPTTRNRQGADRGSQYRSVIFYHDDRQKRIAERSLAAKDASGHLRDAIVTEIVPATEFFPAESYHQDYFARDPSAAYCRMVIRPKLEKLGLSAE